MPFWTVEDRLDTLLEGVRECHVHIVGGEVAIAAGDCPSALEVERIEGEAPVVEVIDGVVEIRYDRRVGLRGPPARAAQCAGRRAVALGPDRVGVRPRAFPPRSGRSASDRSGRRRRGRPHRPHRVRQRRPPASHGGGPMSRVFGHGDLRLYLLKLLDERPRHGYELIRLLEDRFYGLYTPSAGTIYPRLSALEDDGLVTHDVVDGRKVYRLTDAGRDELAARGDQMAGLEDRVRASTRHLARE